MKDLLERMKRNVAAVLVVVMMVQNVLPLVSMGAPLVPQAPTEGQLQVTEHTPTDTHSPSDPSEDLYVDDQGEVTLSGKIIYMSNRSGQLDQTDLQLYVNGKLDTTRKPEFGRSEDDRRTPVTDDSIDLINDLEGDVAAETASPSDASFDVWEYRYIGLPATDADGNSYQYEIRDAAYGVATASQALYYTDAEGTEILGEGEDLSRAYHVRMVYVDRTDIGGSYAVEEGLPEDDALYLDVTTERDEDADFIDDDTEAELDSDAGTWSLNDVLKYNPLTGAPITYRVATVGDESEDYEIIYSNKGTYKGQTEWAYDGGTIFRNHKGGKTFRAVGTITWDDGDDWGEVRPQDIDFLRVYDEQGNDVTELMEITVADTGADVWEYTIDGLSASQNYTLGQSLSAYQCEGMAEVKVAKGIFDWDGVKKVAGLTETLVTRSVYGVIDWNGYNPVAKGREDLDFLRVYAGTRDVTEYVELGLSKDYASQGVWGYTVSGLLNGQDYTLKVDAPAGYIAAPAELELPAPVQMARNLRARSSSAGALERIVLVAETMYTLTIKNECLGQGTAPGAFTYTVKTGASQGSVALYNGSYMINDVENITTDGSIQIPKGGAATLSLLGGSWYSIVQTEGNGVILFDKEGSNNATPKQLTNATEVIYKNITEIHADFMKEWNDNNNNKENRIGEAALKEKLHLIVKLDGERTINANTATGQDKEYLKKLGISDPKADVNEGENNHAGANHWPLGYEGLPSVDENGNVIDYGIEEVAIEGYHTSYKGASGDGVYKNTIVNTSYTEFHAEKQWMDNDNQYGTRPDIEMYQSMLELHCDDRLEDSLTLQWEEPDADNYLEVTYINDSENNSPEDANSSRWQISIKNLIQFDDQGLPYTYYIKEKGDSWNVWPNMWADNSVRYTAKYENALNHFSITTQCYDEGVIINTLEGTTEFSVHKEWADGGAAKEQSPDVVFQLMRFPDKLTLTDGYKKSSPVKEFSYTTATVGKVGERDEDGEDGAVILCSKTEDTPLPRFDVDGTAFVYYIQETLSGENASEYRQVVTNPTEPVDYSVWNDLKLVANGGRIKNQLYGELSVPVTKTWATAAYQNIDAKVVLRIERKSNNPQHTGEWNEVNDIPEENRTITGFSAETLTQGVVLSGLQKYDGDGYAYEYRFVEESIFLRTAESDDYVAMAKVPGTGDEPDVYKTTRKHFEDRQYKYVSKCEEQDDGSYLITNTLTDQMDLKVVKDWGNGWGAYEGEKPTTLTFAVYRNDIPYNDSTGMPLTETRGVTPPTAMEPITFPDLPRYDDKGKEYVYTVEETYEPEGTVGRITYRYHWQLGDWESEDETESERANDVKQATVTNPPPGPGKGIEVKKEWLDGGDLPHREPVTVALFKKENGDWSEVAGSRRTLTLENNWTDYIGISDTDGEVNYDDYMVKEVQIGNHTTGEENHQVSYDNSGDLVGEVTICHHIYEVTNEPNDGRNSWTIKNLRIGEMSVDVDKTWLDGNSTDRPDNASFQLYRNGEAYEAEKTTTDNTDQIIKWDNLQKYDKQGELYQYTVKETKIGGNSLQDGGVDIVGDDGKTHHYISTIGPGEYQHGANTNPELNDVLKFQATNKRHEMINGFQIHKIWKDDGNQAERPDIYFELMRQTDEGEIVPVENFVGRTALKEVPNSEYHEIYEFDPVPRYSDTGEEYHYFAKEGMHVTNSGYRYDPDNGVYPYCFDRSPDDNGQFALEKDEARADGLIPRDGTVVNIREKYVRVTGEKIWKNMGGKLLPEEYPSVTVRLQKKLAKDDTGTYVDVPKDSTAQTDDEKFYQKTLSGKPDEGYDSKYEFTVGATNGFPKYDEITGEEIDYYVNEIEVPGYELGAFERVDKQSFVIQNTYRDSGEYKIEVTKQWEGLNGYDMDTQYSYPNVTIYLRRVMLSASEDDKELEATDEQKAVEVLQYTAESQKVTFANLPKFAPNGRPYRYYITEKEVPGYEKLKRTDVIGADDGNSATCTITNTYDPENEGVVTIWGAKVWNDQNDKFSLRPKGTNNIKLELRRKSLGETGEGELVSDTPTWENPLLTGGNEWKFSFTLPDGKQFPRFAPDGTEYQYWVRETIEDGNLKLLYGTGSDSNKTGLTAISEDKPLKVTNSLQEVTLTAEKKWDDSNNLYLTRPESIKVKVQSKPVDNSPEPRVETAWSDFPSDTDALTIDVKPSAWKVDCKLPKYVYSAEGTELVENEYRAIEVDIPNGYEHGGPESADAEYVRDATSGNSTSTLTNQVKQGTVTSLTATKVWSDDDDQDGLRKDVTVKFQLLRRAKGSDTAWSKVGAPVAVLEAPPASSDTAISQSEWTVTWNQLPEYLPEAGNKEAEYSVKEVLSGVGVGFYESEAKNLSTAEANIWTVENKKSPIKLQVIFEKTWEEDGKDIKWGIRPESITVQLKRQAGGKKIENVPEGSQVITADQGKWIATFSNLPYATGGEKYTYWVEETAVNGYQDAADNLKSTVFNPIPIAGDANSLKGTVGITNTLKTTTVSATKEWNDSNNAYSTRPDEITFDLFWRVGNEAYKCASETEGVKDIVTPIVVGKNEFANINNMLKYSGLPVENAEGKPYQYQIRETKLKFGDQEYDVTFTEKDDKFTGQAGGYQITCETQTGGSTEIKNSLITTGTVTVMKEWDDSRNQDGIRPESVTFTLYRSTSETDLSNRIRTDSKTLNGTETPTAWVVTWTDLPEKAPDGTSYYYQIEEGISEDDYEPSYHVGNEEKQVALPDENDGVSFTVKNSYTPKTMEVTATKGWEGDGNNPSKTRPKEIKLKLLWKVEGSEFDEVGPEDGITDMPVKTISPDADGNWPNNAVWEDLPVYRNATGSLTERGESKPITYMVEEVMEAESKYTPSYSPENGVTGAGESTVITVTNTLTAMTSATVRKVWDDAGNSLSGEIKSATFKLQRKYKEDPDAVWTDVKNSDIPSQSGNSEGVVQQTLTRSSSDVTGDPMMNLPRYDTTAGENQGKEYIYRFVEVSMETQKAGAAGSTITSAVSDLEDETKGMIGDYTYESELTKSEVNGATVTTITNTWTARSVYAKKIWDDSKNQDGMRPDSVTFELLIDQSPFVPAKTVELNGVADSEELIRSTEQEEEKPWLAVWTGLPKAHPDGTPIVYTVREVFEGGKTSITGYDPPVYDYTTASGSNADESYTVTNKHIPETISFTVHKTWLEDKEWLEDRPASIKVKLLRVEDGEKVLVTGEDITNPATLTKDDWSYTWNSLPKYENPDGNETDKGASCEILYLVEELDVDGYEATIATASNGMEIKSELKNTLKTTSLKVEKSWDDQENYFGRRPESVTIQLERRSGILPWKQIDGTKRKVEMTGGDSWKGEFTGLPTHDKNNNPYQYRAVEVEMDDMKLSGNRALGYQASYEYMYNVGTTPGTTKITNTLETTEITGTKTWDDQSNRYDTRPDDIRLTLSATPSNALGGQQPPAQPEWDKSGDEWTWTWKDLPKYAPDGSEAVYSVSEEDVPDGYKVEYSIDHKSMTNTLLTTDLSGTKTWEDQDDRYGLRPETLELTVYADGVEMPVQPDIQWTQPGGSGLWSYQIEGLPELTASGTPVSYTVKETAVAGYTGTQTDNDLLNTLDTGALEVTKVQEGGSVTDFRFQVALTVAGQPVTYTGEYLVSGKDEDITQAGTAKATDAEGTITIDGGQKFRIIGIPTGASYTVMELDKSGYTLKEKQGDQGTISRDAVAEATFTNRKRSSGGDGGSNGGGNPPRPSGPTDPTNPGPGVPTEPQVPTEPVDPTAPTDGITPFDPAHPTIPFDPENPVINIPGDPPKVQIVDKDGGTVYNGSGRNIDIGGWEPGDYTVYTFDDQDVPLGTMVFTINDEGVPLAFLLPKTGDQTLPYALLATIMLGALAGMSFLYGRRKRARQESK